MNWYLKEIESQIETEQELLEKKTLAEKVIYRLVHIVSACHASVKTCFATVANSSWNGILTVEERTKRHTNFHSVNVCLLHGC